MHDMAVVLISKNQEWNIPRLIESVLKETVDQGLVEVILVDSASTDKTIEFAKPYPIQIVQLHADQRLTAAAGRYTGMRHTSAEFVLFLDGDMQLCPGWLDRAFTLMDTRPEVAVIAGQVIDVPKNSHVDMTAIPDSGDDVAITLIRNTGGAAMYRRSVLDQVGAFNPYLYSDEEPELCIRIRHAGHQIVRIETPIVYHHTDPRGEIQTVIGRWRRNLYLGAGQNLRHHLSSDILWPYLRERGYGIIPGAGLLVGIISFVWALVSGKWLWFGAWVLFFVSTIALYAGRERSISRGIARILERLFIADGTLRGFLLRPQTQETSPIRFDRV